MRPCYPPCSSYHSTRQQNVTAIEGEDNVISESASSEPDTIFDQDPIGHQIIRFTVSTLPTSCIPDTDTNAIAELFPLAPHARDVSPRDTPAMLPRALRRYALRSAHVLRALGMQEGRATPSPTPSRPASVGPLSAHCRRFRTTPITTTRTRMP